MSVDYVGDDLEALAALENSQRWILSFFEGRVHGRVAEIGAGIGSFAGLLAPQADELVLVEPSDALIPRLSEVADDIGHARVENLMLEDWLEEEHAPFDAIVMINVLEHIRDDGHALDGLLDKLRPGGHLLLFVPALMPLMSELDRLLGHFRRYHKEPLRQLIEASGFELESLRYFDVTGVAPWFLINRVGRQTGFNPHLARLYDRVFIPATRAIEALVEPPLGKNLVAVARRPA